MAKNKALITGITGQVGSYMAELLLERGWEVHGLVRRSSRGYGALENIKHLTDDSKIYRSRLQLHSGDLNDASSINRVVQEVRPNRIFNYAAQADVAESFFMPEYTLEATGGSVIRILEAINRFLPDCRLVQASTSELFGKTDIEPQDETTPMNPQSPYSVAKYVGYQFVKNYREGYGTWAANSVAFNHASERRTDDYVDRKVTRAVARIKYGLQAELRLGNLSSFRDWSYAPDIAYGQFLISEQEKSDDFVLGSGEKHQVREWVEKCFEYVGLKMEEFVLIDPFLYRPNEVDNLRANPKKAADVLGWKTETSFDKIIEKMMERDLALARIEAKV